MFRCSCFTLSWCAVIAVGYCDGDLAKVMRNASRKEC